MKKLHKKTTLFLLILSMFSLNIVAVFLWQFTYAENTDITASGGTISNETTVETIKTVFGGFDAVNVIKSETTVKIIVKNNIILQSPINITGGNFIIVTDGENRIIKRDNTDSDSDGIIDFNESLFNVTGGTISFGEGEFNLGENNLTYDNLVTNYMEGTLTITGLNETTDGYINNAGGYTSVPALTATGSLVTANGGTINVWQGVKIANNYSTKSCIEINNNSIFNMYGGTVEKCVINDSSSLGGSALNSSASTVNFYDGLITNNEARGTNVKSGAIYIGNNSIANVHGGMVIHNINSGIGIDSSAININGGTIYNNELNDLVLLTNSESILNNGYIDKVLSNEVSNSINIIAGVINNLSGEKVLTYNGKTTTHYEVIIPDGSSITEKDYIKIYDTDTDEFINYYEGPLISDISGLKFYLEPGNYKAVINQNKSYYFTITDSNKTITPSGITAVDETFGSNSDGTISGLTSAQELSFDNVEYIAMPSYIMNASTIPSGVYYVRAVGETDYVEINIKGTTDAVGGTLTKDTTVENVENVFGGTDLVTVNKSGSNYVVTLKSNILLTDPIKITSGNYNIISDGGEYIIKRDITSFTIDMFKITGGTLTIGSSNIINDNTNAVKYLFDDEEIVTNIDGEIPERSVSYIKKTEILTGITNTMTGKITLDGGSVIESGYINGNGNGPSIVDSVSAGVVLNVQGGTVNLNKNVIITNNYNNGTTINGSAVYVASNGIFKMYGGLITKCVRNSSVSTNGSAIYNNGTVYIYSGEISNNETNSNLEGNGTIFLTGGAKLYITDIYLHDNWAKTTGAGIYSAVNSIVNFYNGVNNNNISFGYKNTINNTYTNLIESDVYLENGNNNLNITNGTLGYIKINGQNIVKITEANINNIVINNEYNDVVLYPLVTLRDNLDVASDTLNDINTSVSESLNFLNLTTKSVTTLNSSSTIKIAFYQNYNNNNFNRYLTFSNNLPANTSIILRRVVGNVITNYYYKNASQVLANTPIYLTEFKLLGTTTSFVESLGPVTTESIELIINFEYNGTMQTGKVTYNCGNSYSSTIYDIDDSDEFLMTDFTINNEGRIVGGDTTANPAVYSNFYYGKTAVIIATLTKDGESIPFVLTDGINSYTPAGNIVNVDSSTINNLLIKDVNGNSLSNGNYTLTTNLSMTKDSRTRKYSTLDGILLTKNSDFNINKKEYGLNILDGNRILNINEENNGVFNFNINKTNLENGNYDISVYKKTGALDYSNTSENNWLVSESNSVLTMTVPMTSTEGTYKMIISYIIDGTKVVQKEYNIIIKKE